METITQRIRAVLEDKGWSDRELARRAGWDTESVFGNTFRRLEGDPDAAQIRTVKRIALACGVSWQWLMTGLGSPDGAPVEEIPEHRNLPGFRDAEALVRKQINAPAWAWDKARRGRGLAPPAGVTEDWLRDLVLFCWRKTPPEEAESLENAALDRRIKTLRTRDRNKLAPTNVPPKAKRPRAKKVAPKP